MSSIYLSHHASHCRGRLPSGGQRLQHCLRVALARRDRNSAEHLAVPQQHVAISVARWLRVQRWATNVQHRA
jgi:hypothetical protein